MKFKLNQRCGGTMRTTVPCFSFSTPRPGDTHATQFLKEPAESEELGCCAFAYGAGHGVVCRRRPGR